MRLLALAAVLAAGLAGPATAAIDLGPIAYGLNNGITSAPVEQSSLGLFADEFMFTVVGAPRTSVRASFRAVSRERESFQHGQLFIFVDSLISSIALGGGGVPSLTILADRTTFTLTGNVLALPASYTIEVTITPLPAGALLLVPALAALAAAGRRARRQNGSASNAAGL